MRLPPLRTLSMLAVVLTACTERRPLASPAGALAPDVVVEAMIDTTRRLQLAPDTTFLADTSLTMLASVPVVRESSDALVVVDQLRGAVRTYTLAGQLIHTLMPPLTSAEKGDSVRHKTPLSVRVFGDTVALISQPATSAMEAVIDLYVGADKVATTEPLVADGLLSIVGQVADGSWAIVSVASGLHGARPGSTLHMVGREGGEAGPPVVHWAAADTGAIIEGRRIRSVFAHDPILAEGPTAQMYVAPLESFVVDVHGMDGVPIRRYTVRGDRVPTTDSLRSRRVAALERSSTRDSAYLAARRRTLMGLSVEPHVPVISWLSVAPDGAFAVRRRDLEMVRDSSGAILDVIDADGSYRGRLVLERSVAPVRFTGANLYVAIPTGGRVAAGRYDFAAHRLARYVIVPRSEPGRSRRDR